MPCVTNGMKTRSAINGTINNDINGFYCSVWDSSFSLASKLWEEGGRRLRKGVDRKQRMKQPSSEGIKDNHYLSWAGKAGYWNIGEPREGALGIFLITQSQESATCTEQGRIPNPMQSTPSLEGY